MQNLPNIKPLKYFPDYVLAKTSDFYKTDIQSPALFIVDAAWVKATNAYIQGHKTEMNLFIKF